MIDDTDHKGNAFSTQKRNLQVAIVDLVFRAGAGESALASNFLSLCKEAREHFLQKGKRYFNVIGILAQQFQTIPDPDVKMWIVDSAVSLGQSEALNAIAAYMEPADSPILKQKVVRKIIEIAEQEALKENPSYNEVALLGLEQNIDSLDPESRRLFELFAGVNFPMLHKMIKSNKKDWQYPVIH
jgi:hypothetical protein